ncbi:hypothetical protein D3C81_788550 [compost metagenome]
MCDLGATPAQIEGVADFHVVPGIDVHRHAVLGHLPVNQAEGHVRRHQAGMMRAAWGRIGPAGQGDLDLDPQARRRPFVAAERLDREPYLADAFGNAGSRHEQGDQVVHFLGQYHDRQWRGRHLFVAEVHVNLVAGGHLQVRLDQHQQPLAVGFHGPHANAAIKACGMIAELAHVRDAHMAGFDAADLVDAHEPGNAVGRHTPGRIA